MANPRPAASQDMVTAGVRLPDLVGRFLSF